MTRRHRGISNGTLGGTFRIGLAALLLLGTSASAEVADAPSSAQAGAAAEAADGAAPTDSEAKATGRLVYRLPSVGKPGHTVGGGRRSLRADLPQLAVLVPDHVGTTVSAQPVLYWYLPTSPPPGVEFEFTLSDRQSIQPVVDVDLAGPMAPGVHRVDLEEHGVTLVPDREYEWSVSLVVDRDDRFGDVVAKGWIERVSPSVALKKSLRNVSGRARSVAFGEAGIWYDLLDSVYVRLPAERAQADLRQLLAQVGLPEEAAN